MKNLVVSLPKSITTKWMMNEWTNQFPYEWRVKYSKTFVVYAHAAHNLSHSEDKFSAISFQWQLLQVIVEVNHLASCWCFNDYNGKQCRYIGYWMHWLHEQIRFHCLQNVVNPNDQICANKALDVHTFKHPIQRMTTFVPFRIECVFSSLI